MVTKRDLLNLLPDDKKLCRIYGWERKRGILRTTKFISEIKSKVVGISYTSFARINLKI